MACHEESGFVICLECALGAPVTGFGCGTSQLNGLQLIPIQNPSGSWCASHPKPIQNCLLFQPHAVFHTQHALTLCLPGVAARSPLPCIPAMFPITCTKACIYTRREVCRHQSSSPPRTPRTASSRAHVATKTVIEAVSCTPRLRSDVLEDERLYAYRSGVAWPTL